MGDDGEEEGEVMSGSDGEGADDEEGDEMSGQEEEEVEDDDPDNSDIIMIEDDNSTPAGQLYISSRQT